MLSCSTRELSTCWDSTLVFFCIGFESGQHVAILICAFYPFGFMGGQHVEFRFVCSCIWDLTVANVLRSYPCFLLPRIGQCPTCWESMNTLNDYGFESGQHVDIQVICFSMFDSRVVNMLRFHPWFILHWLRELSTCWDVYEYVLSFLMWVANTSRFD